MNCHEECLDSYLDLNQRLPVNKRGSIDALNICFV